MISANHNLYHINAFYGPYYMKDNHIVGDKFKASQWKDIDASLMLSLIGSTSSLHLKNHTSLSINVFQYSNEYLQCRDMVKPSDYTLFYI